MEWSGGGIAIFLTNIFLTAGEVGKRFYFIDGKEEFKRYFAGVAVRVVVHLLDGGAKGGIKAGGREGTFAIGVFSSSVGDIRGGTGSGVDVAVQNFTVFWFAQLATGRAEPEVAQDTKVGVGLTAFSGN